MAAAPKTTLSTSLKLEIIKRTINSEPVSPLVDELTPFEIMQVHQFVLEKAFEFGKIIKGERFTKKDITKYLDPLNLQEIEETPYNTTNKNLVLALNKTKTQIDTICKIIREYSLV